MERGSRGAAAGVVRARWAVGICALVVSAAGCDPAIAPPLDTGAALLDAPRFVDGGTPAVDAPAADGPVLDAPSGSDAPFVGTDAPALDDAGPGADGGGALDGGADAFVDLDAGPPAPTCPFDSDLETSAATELARQGISGVTLGIDMPGCTWIGAAGLADRAAGRAVTTTDGFRIASMTKTFTAAVILQLVEEGRIALTDRLTTWVAFPGGDAITVRHLLAHTSGIYDYYNSPVVAARYGDVWTREEVIDVARAQPLAFPPGSEARYSNTNFYLLGMIIEAVTGNAYEAEVRSRLLTPLGLTRTYVAGVEAPIGTLARGYRRVSGSFVDVTDEVDPSLTWAAGGIVSTTPDLMIWTRALFAGTVLTPAMRTAMLTREPLPGGRTSNMGLGVTIQTLPGGLGVFDSHGGRLQGYYGMIGYLVDHDAVMVELTNDEDGGPNPFMTEMWMVVGLI